MRINKKQIVSADKIPLVYHPKGIDADLLELCDRLETEGYLFFVSVDQYILDRAVWEGYDLIHVDTYRRSRLYGLRLPPAPLLPVGGVLARLGNKTALRDLCTRIASEGTPHFAICEVSEFLDIPDGYTARVVYTRGDIELFACKKC